MGASWLALLFSVRAISKRSKRGWIAALGPILTAGFSMAAVWLLGLPQIDTVGHIRHGLPGLTIQWWWPIPAGECCERCLLCTSAGHNGPHQGQAPGLKMHCWRSIVAGGLSRLSGAFTPAPHTASYRGRGGQGL